MELNFIDYRKRCPEWKTVNTKKPLKYLERVFGKGFYIIGFTAVYEKYVQDYSYNQYLDIVDKTGWKSGKLYINDETIEVLNDELDKYLEEDSKNLPLSRQRFQELSLILDNKN